MHHFFSWNSAALAESVFESPLVKFETYVAAPDRLEAAAAACGLAACSARSFQVLPLARPSL